MTGMELTYIADAVHRGHLSGNGFYTKKCQSYFEKQLNAHKCLLTTSCTDALEMCAILADIKKGDEVIMPSYTFVSTANAFVLRGAKVVFCDSKSSHPNMDVKLLPSLINSNTKAIVAMHYGGVPCDMTALQQLCRDYKLLLIEDAAQAIDSYYKGKPLGSFGDMAAFSFHETKNIQCGEGGLLVINNTVYAKRAEIIWEKGTNRSAFFRGEVNKYGWVDIGSSFLPSELNAAFLWAQIKKINTIQRQRKNIWKRYYDKLKPATGKHTFSIIESSHVKGNNAHLFYILCRDATQRDKLIIKLKEKMIYGVFHYQSLHQSLFYKKTVKDAYLPHSDRYSDCLLRLPLYYELTSKKQDEVINAVLEFFRKI